MTNELDGHVALVTGANHGIGAATAVALAHRGASVFGTYLGAGAEEVAARIAGRRVFEEADLSDPAVPARLFDAAERALGPVDILVNNASSWRQDTFTPEAADRFGRPMQPVSAATFDGQFAVDARATALLIAEFARRHIARGASWGRVISLTSGGPDGFPSEVSYGAAKAALENYTMSAAWELGRYGVTANVVYPAATDTGWITDEIRAAVIAESPLRKVGRPEDVAGAIALLCSEQADSITANIVRLR